jgi:hypothetical protein
MVAYRPRETWSFFQMGLEAALEAEDWPRVRGCRAGMEEIDRFLLRGRCIRTKVSPATGGLEDPLFLTGKEGRHSPYLEAIKREESTIARD